MSWGVEIGVYTGCVSLLQRPFFALLQHISVDVCADDARFTVCIDFLCVVEHPECDVACAAGDVEDAHGLATGPSAGIEGTDEVVFPETVDTEGHGIVHNIV